MHVVRARAVAPTEAVAPRSSLWYDYGIERVRQGSDIQLAACATATHAEAIRTFEGMISDVFREFLSQTEEATDG